MNSNTFEKLKERLLGKELYYGGETGLMDFRIDNVEEFVCHELGELLFLSCNTSNDYLLVRNDDVLLDWLEGEIGELDVWKCATTFAGSNS